MSSFYPQIDTGTDAEPCHCDNCEWTGPSADLEPIQSAQDRLSAGSTVPAGECPECGSLAYLDTTLKAEQAEEKTKAAARAMLAALESIINAGTYDNDGNFLICAGQWDGQGDPPDTCDPPALVAVAAAIAEAEAAGIRVQS